MTNRAALCSRGERTGDRGVAVVVAPGHGRVGDGDVRENCPVSSAGRAMGFVTTLEPLPGSKARVPVPFGPDEVWRTKSLHPVGGTIGGWSFSVSLCDRPIGPGNVVISPEGPQRSDLEPDLRAALEASPEAGAFLDSLAQF